MKWESMYWKIKCKIYYYLKIKIPQIKFLSKKGHENENIKFLILYREDPCVGIFSCMDSFVKQCIYAEKKGYIPIIDMQNFKNSIMPFKEVGKKNAWELFFEQPFGGYNLKDVQKAKNKRYITRNEIAECININYSIKDFTKYIRLIPNINEFVEYKFNEISNKGSEKVLGILARGTDYFLPVHGYHVIDTREFIDYCEHIFRNYGYTKVFLATEDSGILQDFQRRFEKELKYLEDDRTILQKENMFVSEQWKADKIDMEEKTRKYIAAIYILGRCQGFVANAKTSAVPFVQILGKGKYDWIKIFEPNERVKY